MKKYLLGFLSLVLMLLMAACAKHRYETVADDPLQTKIYTLPNGLKVFMTVNKDQPRIQTYIAVRVGGKNDPAETTGLAHYFEHLMFKGTKQFGTSDYAAEEPMLDRIEQLFETYRHTTDSVERQRIYREIDSISYEASKIAIPNEYDKLMSAIGANGTNAYTSYDVTCYVEDIPSNQIENWARIQADRFENPVIRGFHTELETIYEEKNMSLTKDNRKVYEKLLTALYPSHPYGSQTVLGTQENLKNPSITNVKNYHKQWYVPNNMAICLSGDFDPDYMVDVIEKYFGHLEPSSDFNRPSLPKEEPFTEPQTVEVLGPEAEYVTVAWRTPEAASEDINALHVLDYVMNNGTTGILDLNVSLPQRVLNSGAYMMEMADAGAYVMTAMPKEGQSLDEAKDIMLEQVEKLRNGEFTEEFIEAVTANLKLQQQQALTDNSARADYYVDAFVNGIDWADQVAEYNNLDKVTKEDVVAVANKYLGPDNYVVIYKRQGQDPNELKLAKPQLTPIEMNRDKSSAFLAEIQNTEVEPIEPVFVDFDRDLTRAEAKNGVEVLYVPNEVNDIFTLKYVYECGEETDSLLPYAAELIDFVRTPDMTAEDIKNEFYKLACSYSFNIGDRRSTASISGLSENMDKAAALFEKVLAEGEIPAEAIALYADRYEKARGDRKHNQSSNFGVLAQYVTYGPKNSATEVVTPEQIRAIDPAKFTEALRKLNDYEQTVIYWGKAPEKDVVALVNETHPVAENPIPAPTTDKYTKLQPEETIFFISPYEAKQLYMYGYSNKGDLYDPAKEPMRNLYNEYFGGSMNSIVFQEMRERRSLAYSAWAGFQNPGKKDKPYTYVSQIATQNDKLSDALAAFDEIINNLPESEAAFELAKSGLESRLRTERVLHDDIAYMYINNKDKGLDHDIRKDLFEALPTATLDKVVDFQKANVAGRTYYYGILANPENIDVEALKKLGKVVILSQEDIFGY